MQSNLEIGDKITPSIFDVIGNRTSTRKFLSGAPISDDILSVILSAANRAPSAGNLQSLEIYVIKDSTKKKQIEIAALGQDFVSSAPVLLVFCASRERSKVKYGARGEQLYSVQDATIACSYAQLAAAALGVGATWVGAFSEQKVMQSLNLPSGVIPISLLPLGYPHPDRKSRATGRRELSDIVHFA